MDGLWDLMDIVEDAVYPEPYKAKVPFRLDMYIRSPA